MTDRLLVVDSDVFILLSGADLLHHVLRLLGFKVNATLRLPALETQLQRGRSFKAKYAEGVRRLALEACQSVQSLVERPRTDITLDRLIRVEAIDEGEALIFALMTERPALYLASGDKRAMKALARSEQLQDIRDSIAGRVICLESVLRLLVQNGAIVKSCG